jgi:hypothetical protein
MFTGVIDSRDVRSQRGSSSQSSGGSIRHRRTEQEILMERMQEELRQRDEFVKAQAEYNLQQAEYNRQQQEYNRQQQEYFANYVAQQ